MSGIASILHVDEQPVAHAQIEQLVQALAWRGPDHQEAWINGPVAVGAVQLWTTPEAWGTHQPLITPQNDCIVLDGRLDNREALGRMLPIAPIDLKTMSDVELLWLAYKKWGEGCVAHLVGAFAFVIWDEARHTLFAARDPLGLRSFFYFWNGRRFYGASTLQSLLGLPFLEPTLDKDYIWDYLTSTFMGSFDPEATPVKEVRRLPGGHCLQLKNGDLKVMRYWRPWELPNLEYKSDDEFLDHFQSLFREVIAAQCRAVGPLGSALSGGLDSSSVVCIAKELEFEGALPAREFHTFTMLFDESVRQQAGALVHPAKLDVLGEKYGLIVHKIECDDWLPMFDQLPYRGGVPQDEPFIIPSRAYRNMGLKIKQACPDVRVLLTGLGADEGLASSLFFVVDWIREGQFSKAMQVVKQVASASPMSANQILRNLMLAGLGPRSLAYRLRQKQTGPWDMDLGFRFHFRIPRWVPDSSILTERALHRLNFIPQNFKSLATQAAFERNILLLGDNVRLWDDQYIGTASGMEMRHPFYDRRLVEFFLRLPVLQKLGQDGGSKHILRQAMADIVPKPPKEAAQADGEGFLYVYRESLKAQWPQIEQLFADSRAENAGFIDPGLFLQELSEKRFGRGSSPDTAIFSTLALEFWLRELEEPVQPAQPLSNMPVTTTTAVTPQI